MAPDSNGSVRSFFHGGTYDKHRFLTWRAQGLQRHQKQEIQVIGQNLHQWLEMEIDCLQLNNDN